VYAASEGLRAIVVEREAPGGQAGASSRIENYLVPLGRVRRRARESCAAAGRRLGAEILRTRSITRIDAATRQVYLDAATC
jgi:thioredoxin reductase (NADPH)